MITMARKPETYPFIVAPPGTLNTDSEVVICGDYLTKPDSQFARYRSDIATETVDVERVDQDGVVSHRSSDDQSTSDER